MFTSSIEKLGSMRHNGFTRQLRLVDETYRAMENCIQMSVPGPRERGGLLARARCARPAKFPIWRTDMRCWSNFLNFSRWASSFNELNDDPGMLPA
jgi:hypothetical protein